MKSKLVWVGTWFITWLLSSNVNFERNLGSFCLCEGWHSGEGVYYTSRQLFCQLGPIRGSAVGFSSNERRPGKSTSVQRQCEAGFNDIEQRQCAGALASSPVTWSYRRWSGSNQGSSTKLYDIFYFQSDVDFNRMAGDKFGFPGQCGSLFCHCGCSCRRMLFW